MRKIISYSLFGAKENQPDSWEFLFYLRIFYFNVLMNKLVFPDWETMVQVDNITRKKYFQVFMRLFSTHGVSFMYSEPENLCRSMLKRMQPVFKEDAEYVLCRDADALTSYREAQAVQEWLNSDCTVHSIHDNLAHNVPILGGLCGFMAKDLRDKYGSHDAMLKLSPVEINKRGSDQDFLTRIVYEDFKGSMLLHNFKGLKVPCSNAMNNCNENIEVPGVNKRLWVSNLCGAFMGSAGVNEMETLRFFRDFYPEWGSDAALWKNYPSIFYWAS